METMSTQQRWSVAWALFSPFAAISIAQALLEGLRWLGTPAPLTSFGGYAALFSSAWLGYWFLRQRGVRKWVSGLYFLSLLPVLLFYSLVFVGYVFGNWI
jgi:hypothetical protein